MKKNKKIGILGLMLSLTLLSACSAKTEEKAEGIVIEVIDTEKEVPAMDLAEEVSEPVTPEIPQDIQKDIPMVELPEGITGIKAETEKYADLEKLIIEYFEIPEDYLESTSYYYNYVDQNEDGNDEIFVVVNGLYTSGTGGSSALWVEKTEGQLQVNQDFTLINTPIMISDKITNNMHELVIPYYGGGAESQYKILTYQDGSYTPINDGKSVETLEGITGKAIIANDLINEITNQIEGLKLKAN